MLSYLGGKVQHFLLEPGVLACQDLQYLHCASEFSNKECAHGQEQETAHGNNMKPLGLQTVITKSARAACMHGQAWHC